MTRFELGSLICRTIFVKFRIFYQHLAHKLYLKTIFQMYTVAYMRMETGKWFKEVCIKNHNNRIDFNIMRIENVL